jgi:hypothetical protein
MPRRTPTKCPAKAGISLDKMVEKDLLFGAVFGIQEWELDGRANYLEAWRLHRDILLPAWVEAFPGSRPAACYVDREIPPWKWKCRRAFSRQMMRDELDVDLDLSGHRTAIELDHLIDIGFIDDAEIELAEQRLEEPDGDRYSRYKSLAS